MYIARNSLISRQSKDNNNDILMNLYIHHHTMALYKFHENPSTACKSMAEDMKNY